MGGELYLRFSQTPEQPAAADNWPPVVNENLDWPPVRDPSQDDQAFLDEGAEGLRGGQRAKKLAQRDAQGQD